MALALIRTSLATLIAYLGAALGVSFGALATERLKTLVYAATGALLAVTLCDILPDAKALLSWPVMVAATASGYLLFWVIGRYVFHLCPSCAVSAFTPEVTRRLGQTAVFFLIALTIHSTMDGLAVVVGDQVTHLPNYSVLFAVSFHKLPEGMALALILVGAGYARRAALLWTIAIETTTEIGGIAGLFLIHSLSPVWLSIIFAHIGGGFLYLIYTSLDSFKSESTAQQTRAVYASSGIAFACMAALMVILKLKVH